MATIRIRGLSEQALSTLKARAARNAQPLPAYVRDRLNETARTPTSEELADQQGLTAVEALE